MVHDGDIEVLIRSGKIIVRNAYIGDYKIFKTPTKWQIFPIGTSAADYDIDAISDNDPRMVNTDNNEIYLPEAVGGASAETKVATLHGYLTHAMTLFLADYDMQTGDIVITGYSWSKDNLDNVYNVISTERHCPVYSGGNYKCTITWYYINDTQHTEFTSTVSIYVKTIY